MVLRGSSFRVSQLSRKALQLVEGQLALTAIGDQSLAIVIILNPGSMRVGSIRWARPRPRISKIKPHANYAG